MADAQVKVTFSTVQSNIETVHETVQGYFNSNPIAVKFDTTGAAQNAAREAGAQAAKTYQNAFTQATSKISNVTVPAFFTTDKFGKAFKSEIDTMGHTIEGLDYKFKSLGKNGSGQILEMTATVRTADGQLEKLTQRINTATGKSTSGGIKATKQAAEEMSKETDRAAKASAKSLEKVWRLSKKYAGQDGLWLKNQQNKIDTMKAQGAIEGVDYKQLTTLSKTAFTAVKALENQDGTLKTDPELIKAATDALRDYEIALKNVTDARKGADLIESNKLDASNQFQTLQGFMTQYAHSISKSSYWTDQFNAQLGKAQSIMDSGQGDVKQLAKDINDLQSAFMASGGAVQSFAGKMFTMFKSQWDSLVIGFAMRAIRQGVKQMWTSVKEIDAALTQLRIVSGKSAGEIRSFGNDCADVAKQIGVNVTDIVSSVETYARLGYTLQDALTLSEKTNIFANIAAIDINDATSGITSILKGFDMQADDAEYVTDVLTEVGQKYAVSASELSEALQNSSAVLNQSNTSFEKSVALIAAGNAAVQDASKVGNALKTTSMRIRGATSDLEEAGLDTEGMAESVSKLREEINALTGVDIMIDDDSFKDIYDIFVELSKVWDDLSDVSRANVLELISGKRNAQVTASILNNINDLTNSYETATNAAGAAEAANAKYLDSIQGRTAQLEATFQQFSNNALDSSVVKAFISALNGVLNVLNSITKLFGITPILVLIATIYKFITGLQLVNTTVLQSTVLLANNKKENIQVAAALSRLSERQRKIALDTLMANKAIDANTREWYENQSATLSASNGLKGIGKSFSQGGWVGLVIGLVIAILTAIPQIIDGVKQKISDTASSAEDLKEELKNIDSSGDNILELRDKLDKGNLSESEAYEIRKELIKITGELTDEYGKEINAINSTTDSLKNYIKEIKAARAAEWLQENQKRYNTAKKVVNKKRVDNAEIGLIGISDDFISEYVRNLNDNNIKSYVDVSSHATVAFFDKTYREIIDFYEGLIKYAKEYKKEFENEKAFNNFISDIQNQIDAINTDTYQDRETIFSEGIVFEILDNDEVDDYYYSLISAEEEYQELLAQNKPEEAAKVVDEIIKKYDAAIQNGGWLKALLDNPENAHIGQYFIDNFFNIMQQRANQHKIIVAAETDENVQGAIRGLADRGYSSDSFKGKILGRTESTFGTTVIDAITGESLGLSYEELSWFIQLNTLATITGKSVYELVQELEMLGMWAPEDNSGSGVVNYLDQIKERLHNIDDVDETLDPNYLLRNVNNQLKSHTRDYERDRSFANTLDEDTLESLIDNYPELTDEIDKYSEGLISAYELQKEFQSLLSDLDADAFAESVSAAHEAYSEDDVGHSRFIESLEDMEKYIPNVTDYLIDENGQLISGAYAATASTEAMLSFVEAQIATQLAASGFNVSGAVEQFGSLAAAAAAGAISVSACNDALNGEDISVITATLATIDELKKHTPKVSRGGGGGNKSIYSKSYEKAREYTEDLIKLSEARQERYDEESEDYQIESAKQYAYATKLAQDTEAEIARLRAKGYDESNADFRALLADYEGYLNSAYSALKALWESQNNARREAIEKQQDAEEERWEEREKQLEHEIDMNEALLDLEEKYRETISSVHSELRSLDAELATAKAQFEYLDEETRLSLFNDDDYAKLVNQLKAIEDQATALYEDYQKQIENVSADSTYELEGITAEFERQYELLLKQYEVSKADLAIARARRELENVMNERNVAMLVNGVWTWVADPESVKAAVEAVYEAQGEAEDSLTELHNTQRTQALEEFITALEMQKEAEELSHEKIMDSLDAQIEAINNLKFNFESFAQTIMDGGAGISSAISEAIKMILGTSGSGALTKEKIKAAQEKLMALGYNVGSTGADGILGKNTKAAIQQFQKDNGLSVTGNLDYFTLKKLGLVAYGTGGVNDFTGLAQLHGTPSNPEVIFNSADAAKLYGIVHNTSNLGTMLGQSIVDGFIKSVTARFGSLGGTNATTQESGNTIYIGDVKVVGDDANRIVEIFSRVVPTFS